MLVDKDEFQEMYEAQDEFQEMLEAHNNYGTDRSELLKEVIAAGFNPIAITVMTCEETFIFKGSAEASEAAKQFLPEGWWYGLSHFHTAREDYLKKVYNYDEDLLPTVYWLDENFRPKD